MSNQPDDYNLDPTDPHDYSRRRAEHLRKIYGDDNQAWGGKDFGQLDTSTQKARQASQELRNEIASAGLDGDRPLRFSVRIANRDIALQLAE